MRNGDVPPSVPVILRFEVTLPRKAGRGDGTIVGRSGQIGRLFEYGGYSALNNGQREFAAERLAPRRGFEPRFTAPETTTT
jgi:hypothetical protein